jgi:hypothetical protein
MTDHHEISLLNRFAAIAMGKSCAPLSVAPNQPGADMAYFAQAVARFPQWQQDADKYFREIIFPLIQQDFPELLTHEEHQALLTKLKMVTTRVFAFHLLTALARKAALDPALNIYFSATYVIYDTLFDQCAYFDICEAGAFRRIEQFSDGSLDVSHAQAPLETLFCNVFAEVRRLLPQNNRSSFMDIFHKLGRAQLESASFKAKTCDMYRLRFNTFLRGGYASQLSALLSVREFTDDELDSYFILGATIQLADDLGDVLEDRNDGMMTLPGAGWATPNDAWAMYEIAMLDFNRIAEARGYDQEGLCLFRGMVAYYVEKNVRHFSHQPVQASSQIESASN